MTTVLTEIETAEKCDHIHRVGEWGVEVANGNANYIVKFWDCSKCGIVLDEPIDRVIEKHEHLEYVEDCFTCRAMTVQFSTGDANSNMIRSGWTNKKWDGELQAYRDARSQGIQPASTKMKDIKAAMEISDKTGKAYQAR
jgi:hypothetical protein